MDIRSICECAAGGMCCTRGIDTAHWVFVVWSAPDDPRDPNTIASPLQLDEWIGTHQITAAFCSYCGGEDVITCPAFARYLQHPRWDWDVAPNWRAALRTTVRDILAGGDDRLARSRALAAAIRDVLVLHGSLTDHDNSSVTAVGGVRNAIQDLWESRDVGVEALAYWARVMDRYLARFSLP